MPVCFRFGPSVRVRLGFILLAAGLSAARGEAQSKTAQTIPDCRLTEPMLWTPLGLMKR